MKYLNTLTSIDDKHKEILLKFLDKLSHSTDEEEPFVCLEESCFLPLVIQKPFSINKDIEIFSLSFSRIQNGDLMYCPEFSIFREKSESGEDVYVVGEYIDHNYGHHIHFLEISDDSVKILNDENLQEGFTRRFEGFLEGLMTEGYLDFNIVTDWTETECYKEYYNQK